MAAAEEKREGAPGVLILEDGLEFRGRLFGAATSAATFSKTLSSAGAGTRDRGYGEVVFNTSLTGYQEILTDPSYYGQIVCMTVPHVGNTGVNGEDPESPHPWCAGFVVHEACETASNWRSQGQLDQYLKEHGIPGLYDVDTRALTRRLRSSGVIRGVILPEADAVRGRELLAELPGFEGRDMIGEVSTPKPYTWPLPGHASGNAKNPAESTHNQVVTTRAKRLRVVAMDFGVKWNLLRSLDSLGCDVEVVPAKTTATEILGRKPDGVFLSNGPGDPTAAPYAASTVRELLGKVPIFGVCMGHQILSLALGGRTYKLKFGHRGGNQPVLDKNTGQVEISSHNHGYSVDGTSLPPTVQITHTNLNDKTVEGLAVPSAGAFSVQYHPEACPGPHDSRTLFVRFVELMDAKGSR